MRRKPVEVISVNDIDKYRYNVYIGSVAPRSAVSDIAEGETLASNSLINLKRVLRARRIDGACIQSIYDTEWTVKQTFTGDYLYMPRY